ncbi:MAG: DNA primase [Parcubacteria group bacterium Gr01-1014_29]|nr:MAG: DNA primase [Parcubacteria group bacterium Gr01-1014_29]
MTPVEEIKSRLSVVDVISTYLKLIRAGSNFKAVCPFHSEKTPSFFISPARDVWHCFGCQKGGDQFQFVMEIEGVEFREALRILAQRAGVELRHENPEVRNEHDRLLGLMELAVRFYEASLKRFPAVEAYIKRRGLVSETIEKFRIGYAPPESAGWRVFTEHVLKKGYTLTELEKSGLAIRKQPESSTETTHYSLLTTHYYDRFRNRVMFPVADHTGRVVGFGGRIFSAEGGPASGGDASIQAPAKYINSPQTALYDKSRILYGFEKAKVAMRKENTCIVVEGYMDAVMAHQAGTENVVAVSGTALTHPQLTMLRRLCDRLATSFDMDEAGESATRRSIDLALEIGFDVKAITLPSGKDPADLVCEDPVKWREAAAGATDVISYFFDKAHKRFDARTLEGKRGITQSVFPLIARLSRQVEKAHWVGRVASRLGIREEAVWDDLKKQQLPVSQSGAGRQNSPMARPQEEQRTRAHVLEERILGLLYAYRLPLSAELSENLFTSDAHRLLYAAYASDTKSFIASLADERLRLIANRLVFEVEMVVPPDGARAEYVSCIGELEREHVKHDLERITEDIRKAEEVGNEQLVSMLADEFRNLSQKLNKVLYP